MAPQRLFDVSPLLDLASHVPHALRPMAPFTAANVMLIDIRCQYVN